LNFVFHSRYWYAAASPFNSNSHPLCKFIIDAPSPFKLSSFHRLSRDPVILEGKFKKTKSISPFFFQRSLKSNVTAFVFHFTLAWATTWER
jgi:hypothetical protein